MKLRDGFVSNSSTCSFVFAGYKVGDISKSYQGIIQKLLGITPEEIVKRMRQDSYYKNKPISQDSIEDFCADWVNNMDLEEDGMQVLRDDGYGEMIVGVDLENGKIDFDDVAEKLKVIGERLGTDQKAKVYSGEYSC